MFCAVLIVPRLFCFFYFSSRLVASLFYFSRAFCLFCRVCLFLSRCLFLCIVSVCVVFVLMRVYVRFCVCSFCLFLRLVCSFRWLFVSRFFFFSFLVLSLLGFSFRFFLVLSVSVLLFSCFVCFSFRCFVLSPPFCYVTLCLFIFASYRYLFTSFAY